MVIKILSRGSMRSVCGANGVRELVGWGLFLFNFFGLFPQIREGEWAKSGCWLGIALSETGNDRF